MVETMNSRFRTTYIPLPTPFHSEDSLKFWWLLTYINAHFPNLQKGNNKYLPEGEM